MKTKKPAQLELFAELNNSPRNRYLFVTWKSWWGFLLSYYGDRTEAEAVFETPHKLGSRV